MRCQRRVLVAVVLVLGISLLAGCTRRNSNGYTETTTEFKTFSSNAEAVALTGVITALEEERKTLKVTDVSNEWNYTMSYDVYTQLLSRYGEVISISQIEVGDMVDVSFDEETKLASKIQISYDSWEYEKVKGLTYNQSENRIFIMGSDYIYTPSLVLHDKTGAYSDKKSKAEVSADASGDASADAGEESKSESKGQEKDALKPMDVKEKQDQSEKTKENNKEETLESKALPQLELSDISSCDTVTCRGYKGKIYAVVLESGHGYVRLSDYSSYLGGMIVIGDLIQPVTTGMVLTVPTGEWTLEIDKNGKMGTKKIIVSQNVEQTVSLAELTIVASQKGIFHFVMSPADATVTVDGVDYTGRTDFMLEYGVHKIAVSAVDYKSYNGTVNLQVPYMNINVSLVPLDSDEDSTADASTTTQDNGATTQSTTTEAVTESTTTETSTTEAAAATTSDDATTQE